MSKTADMLLALERGFWTGDEAYFRANTDSDCLVAFADMAGVMANRELAATAKKPNRWKDLEMELKGVLEPRDGLAFLSYDAKAVRDSGEPYAALVSTGYVRRDDGWKMVFHAQAERR